MNRMHNRPMPFPTATPHAVPERHVGYVAGRYRNSAYSDIWTDVRRCAERTFTAYAPACSCGWQGRAQPATDVGHLACRRIWAREHLAHVPGALVGDYGARPADGRAGTRPELAPARLATGHSHLRQKEAPCPAHSP
jgi:hypothetical protein